MASKKAETKPEAQPKKDQQPEQKLSEEVAKVLDEDDDEFEEFQQEAKIEIGVNFISSTNKNQTNNQIIETGKTYKLMKRLTLSNGEKIGMMKIQMTILTKNQENNLVLIDIKQLRNIEKQITYMYISFNVFALISNNNRQYLYSKFICQ